MLQLDEKIEIEIKTCLYFITFFLTKQKYILVSNFMFLKSRKFMIMTCDLILTYSLTQSVYLSQVQISNSKQILHLDWLRTQI